MKDMLGNSVFFGVMVSVLAYELGVFLKRRLKWAVCNPLLISIVLVMVILAVLGIDYEDYNEGAQLYHI